MSTSRRAALVVGGGPAGLAVSYFLRRRNIDHVVLERGDTVGYTWARFYRNLRLHTGKHLSSLPGLAFPRETPLFPTRQQFLDYLRTYARTFDLPVETDCEVARVRRDNDGWIVEVDGRSLSARHLVVATGIAANPYRPSFEGEASFRGAVLHSVGYETPDSFHQKRVLVVGVGNSGAEIASELATVASRVAVAVRSGANIVPLNLLGVPIHYWSVAIERLPLGARRTLSASVAALGRWLRGSPPIPPSPVSPVEKPPIVGFHLADAVRAGKVHVRPPIAAFTPEGVRFTDGVEEPFDAVILATGFRAAVGFLGGLVSCDARGFPPRSGVESSECPRLYFAGHTYSAIGALLNIRREASTLAKLVAERL